MHSINTRAARPARALVGCLIAAGAVLLILGIASYLVATNWRGWAADLLTKATTAMLEQSDLPEAERKEMIVHIADYASDFESGAIGFDAFQRTMELMSSSSLIPVGMVYTVDEGYLKPSEMPDEEKAAASLELQRLARGVHEQTIPSTAVEEVLTPISYRDADGTFRLNVKSAVTPDMLRAVAAEAKSKADAASVPAEPFVVDLSDELKRLLDESRTPAGG